MLLISLDSNINKKKKRENSNISFGDKIRNSDGTLAVVLDKELTFNRGEEDCWKVYTENGYVDSWYEKDFVKIDENAEVLCKHKDSEVICWHWTHGESTYEIRFLEIQMRCKDCGKYHFKYIRDWDECEKFISKHKNKQWSDECKPVL